MAALAARTNSARTDSRLHYIARQLGPFRGTPSVADFFDAYQSASLPREGNRTDSPPPGLRAARTDK